MGVFHKFSPERADIIIDAVRKGIPLVRAAPMAGVHRGTIYDWLKRGEEDPDSEFGLFASRVEQARSELFERCVRVVVEDSLGEDQDPKLRFQAAKFWLTHAFSEDFATRQVTEVVGPHGGPVQLQARPALTSDQVAALTDEQLDRLRTELLAGLEGPRGPDVIDAEPEPGPPLLTVVEDPEP